MEANHLIPDLAPAAVPALAGRKVEELLSISALSRKIDVHAVRISSLVHKGILMPDFTSGGVCYFRPARVAKIKETVERHRVSHRFVP